MILLILCYHHYNNIYIISSSYFLFFSFFRRRLYFEGALSIALVNAATAASSLSCSKLRMSGIVVDLGLEDINDNEEETSGDLVEDNGKVELVSRTNLKKTLHPQNLLRR